MSRKFQILLTDDEVASLAVARQTAWPSSLPTVPDDERALLDAVVRGRRSLLVRGLLTLTEGSGPEVDRQVCEWVDAVLSHPLQLSMYIGLDNLSPADPGFALYAYAATESDRAWLTSTVSSDGVHAFAWQTREEVLEAAQALLTDAAAGLPGDDGIALGQDRRFIVLRPGDSPQAVIAGFDGLRAAVIGVDEDALTLTDLPPLEDARQGIALLGFSSLS